MKHKPKIGVLPVLGLALSPLAVTVAYVNRPVDPQEHRVTRFETAADSAAPADSPSPDASLSPSPSVGSPEKPRRLAEAGEPIVPDTGAKKHRITAQPEPGKPDTGAPAESESPAPVVEPAITATPNPSPSAATPDPSPSAEVPAESATSPTPLPTLSGDPLQP